MTRATKLGTVFNGAAVMVIATGLMLGPAGTVQAEPTTSPAPAPAESASPAANSAATTAGQQAATATTTGEQAATATTTGQQAAGDVLDLLAQEYAVGAGGGQLSNLLKVALKLRAMGFKPSKQYLDEITAAMKYRPNQGPLIAALKDTIAYQQKIRAQTQILQQAQSQQNANSAVMGAGQMPADSNPAAVAGVPQPAAPMPGPPMAPAP